ncbi:MFS transporter [Leucobacter massiliensis]|uniref:Major facilitator superfamily (MFS) profile domain-containing protein n=1 Tax=Leucobacter massiliensis TaxID=1686285 RepID=A0A2S9QLJ2_9MICO|nr:MFS transporter [Leucobacter massiliensis]PRI10452.1 hypothetical protein B4915_11765 [Leucobacter massiliensis]
MSRTKRGILRTFRALPAQVRLILFAMAGFNAGFSLVIPFLAVHMTENLHLGAALVGLILGARMAAQQGLFALGGALSDRFGVRPMVLTGIALRIVGLLTVGIATHPGLLLIGILLVGVAAAAFAPAVESANASYGARLENEGVLRRTELFAIEQVFSRIGTALGPVIGTALVFVPFIWTSLAASLIFAALLIAFAVLLPRALRVNATPVSVRKGMILPLKNRAFLAIAIPGSLYLGAQNLFYVFLPAHIAPEMIGAFYIGSALVVIAGQAPLRMLTRNLPTKTSLVGGLLLTAIAFAVPGSAFLLPVQDGSAPLIGALIVWTVLLQLGQMLIMPALRDRVARTAGEGNLGSYFGMLSTLGGFLALGLTWASGAIVDVAGNDAPGAWLAISLVFVLAGFTIRATLHDEASAQKRRR